MWSTQPNCVMASPHPPTSSSTQSHLVSERKKERRKKERKTYVLWRELRQGMARRQTCPCTLRHKGNEREGELSWFTQRRPLPQGREEHCRTPTDRAFITHDFAKAIACKSERGTAQGRERKERKRCALRRCQAQGK